MEVGNPIGSTVNLRSARVDRTARLSTALVCPDPRPHRSGCPHPGRVTLDGFTFGELQTEGWSQWLHLIRFHTNHYHPQPYQQLAAAERGSGHDANARHVLIAQQHDLRRLQPRAIGGRPARFAHWLWGVLGGYGYRALRLAVALAIALALSGGLGVWAGHVTTRPGHHVAERTAASGSPPGTPCTTVELVGLGLDRGLPLGVTGLRARCDLDTGTDKGQAFTVAVWGVQIAVWILATLAIAGYTGLIRKSS